MNTIEQTRFYRPKLIPSHNNKSAVISDSVCTIGWSYMLMVDQRIGHKRRFISSTGWLAYLLQYANGSLPRIKLSNCGSLNYIMSLHMYILITSYENFQNHNGDYSFEKYKILENHPSPKRRWNINTSINNANTLLLSNIVWRIIRTHN